MFPMCLFNWRKIMQREKWKTMDVILVILAIFLLVFVIASNGVQGVQTRLKRKDRFESK